LLFGTFSLRIEGSEGLDGQATVRAIAEAPWWLD
jgi:hypothetical protein